MKNRDSALFFNVNMLSSTDYHKKAGILCSVSNLISTGRKR
jgi:hypothetical protein